VSKLTDAQAILKALGLPTAQQNEISGYTLIALCGLKKNQPWSAATRSRRTVTKGVMDFVSAEYDKNYAPNTRETFRRQVLHQFTQARIADYNPYEPDLPTNSPRAHYALTEDVVETIKTFGTPAWAKAVAAFIAKHGELREIYARHREQDLISVKLADGSVVKLSPGKHNEVQRAVVMEFAPRFAAGSHLLYLGDTAKKNLVTDVKALAALGLVLGDHDKLPDLVFHDPARKWLFLIEAVTSHGPMTPKRVHELEKMLGKAGQGLVYVSAFPDMAEFRKHLRDIAWETEVWIADIPEHLIHFNGDKFFGPRKEAE
jgi:type II restriction enzyme